MGSFVPAMFGICLLVIIENPKLILIETHCWFYKLYFTLIYWSHPGFAKTQLQTCNKQYTKSAGTVMSVELVQAILSLVPQCQFLWNWLTKNTEMFDIFGNVGKTIIIKSSPKSPFLKVV